MPPCLLFLVDPGAGKTTLLRRIGKDLADNGNYVFELRAGIRSTSQSSDSLHNLLHPSKQLPIVLIDDIFRYDDIEYILKSQFWIALS